MSSTATNKHFCAEVNYWINFNPVFIELDLSLNPPNKSLKTNFFSILNKNFVGNE